MNVTAFSLAILEQRYLRKDESGKVVETPDQMLHRVAREIALAEKENDRKEWEDAFYRLMEDKLFMPNSPTLANAGTPNQLLSGCFVLPIEDSMDSIYSRLRDIAIIQKSGGGTGMSFSRIRPKGDIVSSTKGVASGPVAFMMAYNGVTESVKQGGMRRGANMGILKVDHPDIEEFITCKDTEGFLNNFNISVAITDHFMDLVQVDGKLLLVNPRTNKSVGSVSAKELFQKIIHQAWKNGEPGVWFVDRTNREHKIKNAVIESTNPCITGDALVPTIEGLKQMRNLKIGDYICVGKGKFEKIIKFYDVGTREVLRIQTHEGYTIRCTPDHQLMTPKGLIRANQLNVDDELVIQTEGFLPEGGDREEGRLAGFTVGDGAVNQRFSLYFGMDKALAFYFNEVVNRRFGCNVNVRAYKQRSGNSSMRLTTGNKKAIEFGEKWKHNWSFENVPKEFLRGFIEGLFAADGHIERGNQMSIALSSISLNLLHDVQIILGQFGIKATIYPVPRKGHPSDEKYSIRNTQQSYRLQIFGTHNLTFIKEFEFLSSSMKANFISDIAFRPPQSYARITVIEPAGSEPVYDFETDGSKLFYANCILNLDCGEQPLLPYESCNLGSINLAEHITSGEVDFQKLTETVWTAVRFLDNVIDRNVYPIDKIEKQTKSNRKIGLGIMGWHDMLIKLRVAYDSDQAVALIHEIMSIVQEEALQASVDIAEEKGPFPNFMNSVYSDWKHAPRNAERITIAPTGTISNIVGCSSGIEPHYAMIYKRKFNDKEYEIRNQYLDEELSSLGMQWDGILRNNGTLKNVGIPSGIKRIYKTALEVPVEWHIKHQATFQQYVDAAVSKTINCAYETKVEEIEAAIMMAWNMGCKGITIYRDGSRAEQVLSSGRRQISKPKDRPQIIDAKVVKIKTGCGSMFATVGTDNGQILEVLTNIGRSGGCAQAMTEALCRVISIALRAGIDIELIVEQLEGIRCPHIGPGVGEKPALSCADALAKAIKKIRPDIKITPRPVAPCPKCGGKLMFSEGCESCTECEYQRCG